MRPIVSELTGELVDPDVFAKLAARTSVRVVKASLMFNGLPVVEDLPVIGGGFRSDRNAAVRTFCTVVVPAMQALEALGWSEGEPLPNLIGWELVVRRGIRVREFWPTPGGPGHVTIFALVDGDGNVLVDENGAILVDTTGGSVEGPPGSPRTERYDVMCPTGVFPIQGARLDDESWEWEIRAADRAWKLDLARLEQTVEWTSEQILEDVVAAMVANALGDVPMSFVGDEHTAPWKVHEQESSPLKIVHEAALSVGYQAYFDEQGTFVWEPEPTAEREPVAELVDGEYGMLLSCSPDTDYTQIRNKAIAQSSATDLMEPIQAVAVNDDPSSAAAYGGPYGKAPVWVTGPDIRSGTAAQAAANTRLGATSDLSSAYSLKFVPHPALQEGDVVRVRRSRLGIDEVVVLDAKTEDWRPDGGPDTGAAHSPTDPSEE